MALYISINVLQPVNTFSSTMMKCKKMDQEVKTMMKELDQMANIANRILGKKEIYAAGKGANAARSIKGNKNTPPLVYYR
jgi:hypothetical protein